MDTFCEMDTFCKMDSVTNGLQFQDREGQGGSWWRLSKAARVELLKHIKNFLLAKVAGYAVCEASIYKISGSQVLLLSAI